LMMLGVVTELRDYRTAFLDKAELIDLFPTAYYHTTVSEMRDLALGDFAHPEVKLEQLLGFYDAYAGNRSLQSAGSSSVEPHWREHYGKVNSSLLDLFVSQNPWDSIKDLFSSRVNSTLQTGITAHVDYDLGRALRYAYDHRRDRSLQAGALIADFEKTNRVFAGTVLRTNLDIVLALRDDKGTLSDFDLLRFLTLTAGSWFSGAEGDVRDRRMQAWNKAFSGQTLTGIDGQALIPQPLAHRQIYLEK